MKKLFTVFILLVVVMFAVSALAAEKSVTFKSTTMVGGQKIAPGEYKMQYDLSGKTTEVKILKNDKVIATVKAEVVETKDAAAYDAIVRTDNGDGTNALKEIQVANKKQVIRIEGETAVGK